MELFNDKEELSCDTHTSNWKYAYSSVIGTSHISFETPKQDFCKVEEQVINDVNYLFAAVADGAGSAKYSDRSSRYICKLFIRKVKSWLLTNELSTLNRETVLAWFLIFQKVIKRAVKIYHLESIREFATTFLFAILSDKGNVFVQVGDGVIAKGNSTTLDCIFIPQNGEYLNTTSFATDENIDEQFLFEVNSNNVERLVLFTDGIELISFDFSTMKPHTRFFNPIFAQLENSDVIGLNDETSEFISGFLGCERVNQRTDDDKTLVIISSVSDKAEIN